MSEPSTPTKSIAAPKFKPGSSVRVDQGSIHILSTVLHAKYVEVKKPLPAKEGQEQKAAIISSGWLYLLEGEQTRFPESLLTAV